MLQQNLLLATESLANADQQVKTYNKISLDNELIELFNQGKLSRINLVIQLNYS
jgi:hypothetical protein